MAIKIDGKDFDGPFGSVEDLKNASGVYVILTKDGDKWMLLDCGESKDVKDRINNHDRKDDWQKHAVGEIAFAVKYCWRFRRLWIERAIRGRCDLPCGER